MQQSQLPSLALFTGTRTDGPRERERKLRTDERDRESGRTRRGVQEEAQRRAGGEAQERGAREGRYELSVFSR